MFVYCYGIVGIIFCCNFDNHSTAQIKASGVLLAAPRSHLNNVTSDASSHYESQVQPISGEQNEALMQDR